jgi:hypothetical protein
LARSMRPFAAKRRAESRARYRFSITAIDLRAAGNSDGTHVCRFSRIDGDTPMLLGSPPF